MSGETVSPPRRWRARRGRRAGAVRLLPFAWWLVWFYSAWTTIVLAGGLWGAAAAHWPIAAVMVVGSYFAGSTPMGGGTVAFPVLVHVLDQPVSLGRDFSFCIQATGMSSAAIFLLCRRAPLAGRVLLWAMLGSAATIPVSIALLAPALPDLAIKLLFSCLWAAFGVLTLLRIRDFVRARDLPALPARTDAALGLATGAIGGVATGLTGVGADMAMYCALLLVYRCDLRAAIGTAIALMAFGAMVGTVTRAALGSLDAAVFHLWLAAAPIVVVGAPIGALAMRIIRRHVTLVIASALCVLQLAWLGSTLRLSALAWGSALVGLLLAGAAFTALDRLGRRLRR